MSSSKLRTLDICLDCGFFWGKQQTLGCGREKYYTDDGIEAGQGSANGGRDEDP